MYPVYMGWSSTSEDVLIRVGVGDERREFKGPRRLLAEQSGYIKSLLDTSQGDEINVPSVSPQIFAPILRYVTTGYLDLNSENVYAVLLATHILHMPRAVDLCRSYLLKEQSAQESLGPQESRLPILVKPIPSRKFLPTLYWPPPPQIFAPHTHSYRQEQYGSRGPTFPTPPRPTSPTQTSLPPEPLPSTSLLTGFDEAPPVFDSAPDAPIHETPAKNVREVVKDIACCDGPVRFKRVLNVNYGFMSDSQQSGERVADGKPLYVCNFCKHTFKSHYCYRKHTRRHINPVPVKPVEAESRDMNVQYYPCKTCGSKFPSYYFVHKHRKICHVSDADIHEIKSPQPVQPQNDIGTEK